MQKHKRLKIIYIMSDSPPYEIYGDFKKPEFVFEMADGNWAGIWGYDWADQIGKNVTKLDKDIIFEIWQPDLRADRVYSAELSERVCHKLFPAYFKKNLLGKYCFSDELIREIYKQNESVFQIGQPSGFYYEILNKIGTENKVIGTLHGEITTHREKIFKPRKNQLRTIGYIIDYFKFRINIKKYDAITYMNDVNVNYLKKLFNGNLYKITMGIDVSVFKKLDKSLCRKELNLPQEKKIILSVGRLDYAKQNHKLLKILNELCSDYDFLVIFIGHGEKSYEDYLKKISWKLFKKNQINFTGYLHPELLVKYYNSADLFFMSSESEGAPVVSMEALACGVPVVTTDTGNVSEFLNEHTKNHVVGKYNYSEWKSVLEKFLKGDNIETINIDLVKEKYSWKSVAEKFIEIYRNL